MALPFLTRRGPRTPRPPLPRPRLVLAWMVALSADFLQIALAPVFGPGFISIFDDVLDVFVAIVLTLLLGWHWEFLPGFLVKLVPFVDLVPTWSLACWLATRGRNVQPAAAPSAIPPEPPVAPPVSGGRS
jgi:hypothetical protein